MRKTAQILLLSSALFFASNKIIFAGCAVSVSPSETLINNSATFTLNVSNSGDNPIIYVKIPTGFDSNITVNDATSSGWELSLGPGGFGMVSGSISSGSSQDFQVSTSIGGIVGTVTWGLEASESGDGSNAFGCNSVSSNLVSSLTPTPEPEPTAAPLPTPVITNVSTTVGSATAVITWNTNIDSSGVLSYGTTSGYGSSKDTSQGTSHSVSISSLSASTTYHYKIENSSAGGTTVTTDNTFTTGAAGVNTTITSTVTTTVTTTTTNTVTQTLRDTTPPSIRFLNEFIKIYEEAPLINIKVTDGSGIARIEYTIDGTNYLPIDIEDSFGDKTITTSFVPDSTEDGDYGLIVRATDTSGNKVISKEVNFTIDRLAPRIGPLLVMMGPIIINPNSSGLLDLLVGIEYKFVTSVAGGPNSVFLSCGETEKHELTKNPESGVWSVKIKFKESGKCIPEITAVDGAGNIQTVNSKQLTVNSLGKLQNGTITVYWFDEFSKKFIEWDGLPYGQVNPINTNDLGGYSVVLPKGKYYLEAKAIGKRTSVSNIITVSETVFINDDWTLEPLWKFWTLPSEKQIKPKKLGDSAFKKVNFSFPTVNLGEFSSLILRGKNSIVGLTSSWHPETNDYLLELDKLSKQKVSVYPILLQEKDSISQSVKRRGGYETKIYADPDNQVVKDQSVSGLPMTWIVNKFGQVVSEKIGETSLEEVMTEISTIE